MKSPHHDKFGLTIMETVVVTIILGVIATLAAPRLTQVIEKMKAEEGKQVLIALLNAQKQHFLDSGNDTYANNINDLDITLGTLDNFAAPCIYSGVPSSPFCNDAGYIINVRASTRRDNGTYSLFIRDDGTIGCWPGPADEWLDLCSAIQLN